MRKICGLFVSLAVLAGSPVATFGQETGSSPLPSRAVAVAAQQLLTAPDLAGRDPSQMMELTAWMDAFAEWQTWSAEWGNRRERGWLTGFRERREKPVPPAWLPVECAVTVEDRGPIAQACTLLAEWTAEPGTTRVRQARAAASTDQEAPTKTVWWEHVHLDLLWPATQVRASVYGIVGTHIATTVGGRLQVFLAPGAMFLNVPSRNGSRAWKVATNYGIGYRLFDFSFPGNRRATLHANIAKAWLLSDIADVATGRTMDFAGFSMTFNQTP
jgi:hypothetical protein